MRSISRPWLSVVTGFAAFGFCAAGVAKKPPRPPAKAEAGAAGQQPTSVDAVEVDSEPDAAMASVTAPADVSATYVLWELAPLGIEPRTAVLLQDMLMLELSRVLGDKLVATPSWVDSEIRPLVGACGLAADCLAEAGGGLGVRRVITGVVTTLGDAYSVNLKVIDTGTGKVIAKAQASMTGDRNQMLASIQSLVLKLIDTSLLKGSLLVEIPLKGVNVYIDGDPAGVTPLGGPIDQLSVGEHSLKLSSPVMQDYFTFFTIAPGKQTQIAVDPQHAQSVQAQIEANAPFYKRWWFWTIVGSVVVAAAGGTAYAYSSSGNDGPPQASLGTVDFR
ncbi:MAG: PEGA domain-containing protein [Deltaproteobacteria bacterium]|nr:PEGA domain-containing protein [Deltaproteobacteria bacterium]